MQLLTEPTNRLMKKLYMRGKTLKSNVSVPCAYVEVRFESFNEADRLFHQPANYNFRQVQDM